MASASRSASNTYTDVFTSCTASSLRLASFCSTMRSTWPSRSRMMRPYPVGLSRIVVSTVAPSPLCSWNATSFFNVTESSSGMSDAAISTEPCRLRSWVSCAIAHWTARPVPGMSSWLTMSTFAS